MRTVVGRLIAESDRVVRNLVEGWEEERRVGRLVCPEPLVSLTSQISDTKQSRFPLLGNPSLLPPLFVPSVNPSSNQLSLASIANSTTSHLPNLSSASTLLQSYAQGAKRPGQAQIPLQEEEPTGPDPRDVDRVLGELVALGGRWALFRRFVWGRIIVSPASGESDVKDDADPSDGEVVNGSDGVNGPTAEPKDMDVVKQSGSQRAIENLLKVYYEPLELWFLRMSVEKVCRDANLSSLSLMHSGTSIRLTRRVISATSVFYSRRYILPHQACAESGLGLWLSNYPSLIVGKDN